ncbi:FMN reductase [Bosea sp. (in: a-proteobacteria)]|uniref:FMN reductase n=1 Tax=Bosea sp. (in: a-proteobacteria) TaxID=1871050 RepID=UPI002635A751|nr:FMN reductase [Bosea sp. (in: a-proteobacteria)]MCO5089733.1 FMN reductase [Bosea sp. (in: a-proteobacteria)]
MADLRITGFSGNPARPSRTRALVTTVAETAAARLGGEAAIHDLVDLSPSLGTARRLSELDPQARGIVEAILAADVLVVASPTYKGSYSGLFKHLFDLIDPLALAGKPVILAATGGGDRHALVVEHQLRPLFGFFAVHSAPTALYAAERDIEDGRVTSQALLARIRQSVDEVGRLLPQARRVPALLAAE